MSVPTQPTEGFYYDELSKIRALDPEIAGRTQELKDECREFVDSESSSRFLIKAHLVAWTRLCKFWFSVVFPFTEIGEFQGLSGSFIDVVDNLAKCVEREKMKAIGARNHLKSISKERESQKQQLQALIAEKKMQLERSAETEWWSLSKWFLCSLKDTKVL